jgi:hypothetical protein
LSQSVIARIAGTCRYWHIRRLALTKLVEMSRELLVVAASAFIVLSAGLSFAEEDIAVVSGVSFCLSPPPGGVPLWGGAVANLVVRNSRGSSVWVLVPKTDSTGPPAVCRRGRFGSEWERGWREVKPGATWYTGSPVGSTWGGSLSFVGEHTLSMSSSLDLDGDYQAEHEVALSVTYHIVEPPPEVLTLAQERGVEVELCKADGAGGARIKAIAIPWRDLENEHQARVRVSIALPIPTMTPEEIVKRQGTLPKPSDPDDQKRLEEALKTDPAYLRWEALRGKMGLYAGYDFASALETIRLLGSVPRERWAVGSPYFQDMYGPGLDRRIELGAGDWRRMQRTVAVFLEQGKPAALEYLDALAKEELRCADRAFLEEVRAIVLAAPDNLTRGDVVYQENAE